MVIYAEYLFAENFITGGLIFLLSGKIAGIKLKKSLLLLGSVCCGVYSFTLFWNTTPIMALAAKLIFSVIMVLLVFQVKKLRQFCRILLIFYLVSFAMGGITIGAAYFLGLKGVTQNSVAYLGSFTYVDVILGCTITYLALRIFADFIKSRLRSEKTIADVQIAIGNKVTSVKGMVDTGNFLTDPVTNNPVFIISFSAAQELMPDEIKSMVTREEPTLVIFERLMNSSFADKVRLIPYKSIGKEHGYLLGIKPDTIHIKQSNSNYSIQMPKGIILAIYTENFSGEMSGESYSILLHPSAMEGGIACNG